MTGPALILLRFDWPVPALWQNRRTHWAKRAKSVAAARSAAKAEALLRGAALMRGADAYRLTFGFYPPDNRRRDLQNMPATQKAAIDGVADALCVDDACFRVIWPSEWCEVAKTGGGVLCEVERLNP